MSTITSTNKLVKLFNIFDSLSIEILKNAIKTKSIYIDTLIHEMIEIIEELNQTDKSIAELLYERMKGEAKLMDCNKIKNYTELFQFIIQKNDSILVFHNSDKSTKKIVFEFFEKLILHWSIYTIDPDSSMIGLVPTERTLMKCQEFEYQQQSTKDPSILNCEKEDFIKKFISLSTIEDQNELMINIRYYSNLFKGVMDKLKKGDLILVSFSTITKQARNVGKTLNQSCIDSLPSSNKSNVLLSKPPTLNLSELQAKSYFSKTKLLPNRIVSSKSNKPIKIIGLDQFVRENIKPIENIEITSSSTIIKDTNDQDNGDQLNVRNIFNQKGLYARYSGERVGDFIIVYFSSEETVGVAVSLENVIMLNKEVLDSIKSSYSNGNDMKILRHIHQPIDDFSVEIGQQVKMYTVKYLFKTNGIDLKYVQMSTFKSSNNSKPDLTALTNVKRMGEQINKIIDYDQSNYPLLYENLTKLINVEIDKFKSNINQRNYFLPIFNVTKDQLSIDNSPLNTSIRKVKQIKYDIDLSLDDLNKEKSLYLDGTRKCEMSDWWLNLRDSKCNDFLSSLGYKLDALPENYIEIVPSNLHDIYNNYKIIKTILNVEPISSTSTPSKYSPIEIIEQLKSEVYPIIHNFKSICYSIIIDHLKLDSTKSIISNGNYNEIKTKLANQLKDNIISLDLYEKFEMLVLDLEYLDEMESIENNKSENPSFHIVPVGGLAIGHFSVLENCLKTAIEQWSDNPQYYLNVENEFSNLTLSTPPPLKSSPSSSTLSWLSSTGSVFKSKKRDLLFREKPILIKTIESEDYYNFEETLENLKNENVEDSFTMAINDIDSSNGWYPIHSACYIGNVDIANLLLDQKNLDVNVKSKLGDTPLHFIVKHQFSEKRKQLIGKLIDKGINVNQSSKCGETPLHSAILKSTCSIEMVILLLEKGADVNAVTINNETCLHYAITINRRDIVDLLIKFGAKLNIKSKKRGTPLELAYHLKLTILIELMESHTSMRYN